MIIAGIDEAGRGPVLGSLVMSVTSIDEREMYKLVEMGVKDSKLLLPQIREKLFSEIKKICKHETVSVTPSEIDAALSAKKDNLNLIEARNSAKIANTLYKKSPFDKLIIDCPSTNVKKYAELMKTLLKIGNAEVICEHKADFNYPIVAAASILAKVTRDKEMKEISKLVDADLGSGYMTDPRTHLWLQDNFSKEYGFIRRKWATIKNLETEKAQTSLGQFSKKKEEHAAIIAEFDKLLDFGFKHLEPKTHYEILRMQGPENAAGIVIRFTTGKLLVQGSEDNKKKVNAYLQSVGLL